MTTLPSRTITMRIERDWREVYAFAAVPENFPRWASGLGGGLTKVDGHWIADGPEGPVTVRFAEPNAYGVLDHAVELAPGVEIAIPLRVIANGSGAEVIFTLFRTADMDDAKFAADAAWVEKDLASLKRLLEG